MTNTAKVVLIEALRLDGEACSQSLARVSC